MLDFRDVKFFYETMSLSANKTKEQTFYLYAGHELKDTSSYGVDYVYVSTGSRKKDTELQEVLDKQFGIKRVFLSAPGEGEKLKVYLSGINDDNVDPKARIISTSSCTTTSIVANIKMLEEHFGEERLSEVISSMPFISTHAQTGSSGRFFDKVNKCQDKSRGATNNMYHSRSGANQDIGKIFPFLKEKCRGSTFRVNHEDVSAITINLELNENMSEEEFLQMAKNYSEKHPDKMGIAHSGSCSKDMIGRTENCILILDSVKACGPHHIQYSAYYDNIFGYSKNSMDVVAKFAGIDIPAK